MHPGLKTYRIALISTYRRYLDADRIWVEETRRVLKWFPKSNRPSLPPIGEPGSRIKQIDARRERALRRMEAAHHELDDARHRMCNCYPQNRKRFVLLLTRSSAPN